MNNEEFTPPNTNEITNDSLEVVDPPFILPIAEPKPMEVFEIKNIHYSNKERTLYTVELTDGKLYFLSINGDTNLNIFVNYQIEQGLLTVGNYMLHGAFYKKSDATFQDIVDEMDEDLYTTIEPLKAYNDGTTQAFQDTLQAWEYTYKGEELIKEEYAEELLELRQQKMKELEITYNNSKLIKIQGNYTIDIKHDTPERDEFLKKIQEVAKEDGESNTVVSYHQTQNGNLYSLTTLPCIWQYIFKDLFLIDRESGFKESLRYRNKKYYDEYFLKINNATTKEVINSIYCIFDEPSGVLIDINASANKILNDDSVAEWVKMLIRGTIDKDGNCILIVETVC